MSDTVVLRAVVANPNGIHARPSHAIVSTAQEFDAKIELHCKGRRADARSILSVMTLGAEQGSEIEIHASGAQAQAAAERMLAILVAEDA